MAAIRSYVLFAVLLVVAVACDGGGGGSAASVTPPNSPALVQVPIGAVGSFVVGAAPGASVSVAPLPLPLNATFNGSVFTFTPAPYQVGELYALKWTAQVGNTTSQATETLIEVVPGDAQGGTAISGEVRAADTEAPLSGVLVKIPGTAIQSTTNATGAFHLPGVPLNASVIEVHGTSLTPPYAFVAEPIELVLSHTLYAGVLNVIERPIYIPALGAPSGNVSPGSTSFALATTSCGDVLLEVAPNSATLGGQPYSGPIYIPEVEPANTPAALPIELDSGFVIAIQPAGILFNPPAKVTFPNCDSLEPGSRVDIWSISPITGRFAVAGTGEVSPNGQRIETIAGGVSAASWHFPLPSLVPPTGGEGDPYHSPGGQQCAPVGSEASVASGALSVSHSLPSYWRMGEELGLTLSYDSGTAAPVVTADAEISIPVISTVPDHLGAVLTIGGAAGSSFFTDTSGLNEGLDESLYIAMQQSAASLVTGAYPYELRFDNYFGSSVVSSTLASRAIVVNDSTSPYGAGWRINSLQSLLLQQDGSALVLDGQGGGSVFEPGVGPGQGLVTRMYGNATLTQMQSKFASLPPGVFAVRTAAGVDSTNVAYPLVGLDCRGSACAVSYTNGALFYSRGPNGVIETGSPASVGGDDVLFTAPSNADIFGMSMVGYLYVPSSGSLTLSVAVDNYSQVYFDGQLVQSHSGGCPVNADVVVQNVSAGFHSLEIYYLDAGLFAALIVQGSGCGLPGGVIPPAFLFTAIPGGPVSSAFDAPPGDTTALVRTSANEFRRREMTGEERVYLRSTLNPSRFLQADHFDRNLRRWRYLYDNSDRLQAVVDPLGGQTTLAYTASGTLTSITDPAGRTTAFQVDARGDLVRITDPDGSTRRFQYQQHRLTAQVSKRNFRTDYFYDGFGRLIRSRWPDGTTRQLTSQASATLFDPSSGFGSIAQPAPVVRPADRVATVVSGAGQASTTSTNGFGQSTRTTDALGRVTTYVRDSDSLPTAVTLPDGAVVRTVYTNKSPTQVTYEGNNGPGSDDRVWRYTYDPVFNLLATVRDANGNTNPATGVTTLFGRDPRGNLIRVTDALNNVTQLAYDAPGQGVAGIAGLLTSTTDGAGKRTDFFYDPATANVARIVDSTGRITSYVYDSTGRVESVRAEGNDGISSTDQSTSYSYDTLNRVLTVTDNLGFVTSSQYDAAGNLTRVTDAKPTPGITRFAYDSTDRLVSRTDPLGRLDRYSYDANGEIRTRIDRKGQSTTFTYDAARRLTRRDMTAGAFTQYGYDLVDNLTTVVDPDSVLTFGYNAFGDMLSASTAGSPLQPTVDIAYAYDRNGNRISMSPSTGGVVTYTPDKLNRLDLFTDASTASSVDFTYDPVSRRQAMTRTFGGLTLRTDYLYDDAGNLLSLTNRTVAPVASIVSRFQYGLDTLGRRETMTEDRAALGLVGAVHTYGYDAVGQLVSADHPTPAHPNEVFTYDWVGNRLTSAATQSALWTYNVANQLLFSGDYAYTYDLNGNLATRTSVAQPTSIDRIFYDADDQLVRLILNDGRTFDYAYDGLGRRILIRTTGGVPAPDTVFVYDDEDILLELAGGTTLRYTHGPGIDEPLLARLDANPALAFHADGLGSIVETVGATGAVTGAWTYDAFGRRVAGIAGPFDRYGFAAREHDSELMYHRARYYGPTTGRFLSEDAIGFWSGDNLYSYALQDPIQYVDPLGLSPLVATCPIGAFANPICTVGAVSSLLAVVSGVAATVLESRANSDPANAKGLVPVNPGKDCNGACKPCPPDQIWTAPGNQHGSTSGLHYHGIRWNQDQDTCVCYPKRVSGSDPDNMK